MKFLQTALLLLLVLGVNTTFSKSKSKSNVICTVENDTTYIYLRNFGFEEKRKFNYSEIIGEALDNIDANYPTVMIFDEGTYHFYPNNQSKNGDLNSEHQKYAFLFAGINNLSIEGNGSTLIFHKKMQPFKFQECSNVKLKNVNIDWQSFSAKAEVLEVTDDYIELAIDPRIYPHVAKNGKLFFVTGKKQKEQWINTAEMDNKGNLVFQSAEGQSCLGDDWQNYQAEHIIPGIIRLKNNFKRKPAVGHFLVLQHSEKVNSGFALQDSKNITAENVNLFHAPGMGVFSRE